ncbi:adenylate isopentenyltransferase-like [Rutidosis leptorrhynchoides]|uniref:adenylate isopentenyltransferase-like n=1 Tax=Rutidosis leptorrhynchoides TaxID=125765 RepID=UPI003A9A09B7
MKLLPPPNPNTTSFHYHGGGAANNINQLDHHCCPVKKNKVMPLLQHFFSSPSILPCKKNTNKNQNFIIKWAPRMDSITTIIARPTSDAAADLLLLRHHYRKNQRLAAQKEKLIVIMGATGAGKTKLSIELAKRFNGEIINSDKMQVYKGLDITTNKAPINERGNINHHLLGDFDPELGELTRSDFRRLTWSKVKEIESRNKVPFLVGGSTSFVHASLTDRFNPATNVFDRSNSSNSVSSELRYDCCFLWVDVSFNVLCEYLRKRVDEMMDSGMVEELAEYYASGSLSRHPGLRNAIGVPEFYDYFNSKGYDSVDEGTLYEDAVNDIKDNTCRLAKRQIEKILRLKTAGGWGLQRLDATSSFRKVLTSYENEKEDWREIWTRQVVEPSFKTVKKFLEEE